MSGSGREVLERLKAQHAAVKTADDCYCRNCFDEDGACRSWPCGYVGLIAALEEALALLERFPSWQEEIFSKLTEGQ